MLTHQATEIVQKAKVRRTTPLGSDHTFAFRLLNVDQVLAQTRLDYCRADTQCINDGYQYHAVAKANFVWSIATTAPNQRVDIGDDAAAGSSDSGLSTQ
ncbi:hypothetical protein MCOR27_000904 [Pyricularia oryzae]|nr:hypothetical protein MCOR19_002210 [Pyricularia oryzae]KAI6283999.1 hypothetical protein MCOR26_002126 [Pyricularia oryzae]KAI6288585.1 hypothetical protein MCOR27_000904 [Pyricularia oryzae]KAI6330438.1 hypothetical protein MCOR30_005184 [Pyricularia oryzae]KAI6361652.1 hypothetical protein MCOR32_008656 [Pyricularia oryzae]